MHPYQLRVIEERNTLANLLERLEAFIDTPQFTELHFIDRGLLLRQRECQREYHKTLCERIVRFGETQ